MSKAEVFVVPIKWVNETICCGDSLFEDSTAGLGQTYRKCLNCGESWVGEEVINEVEKKEKT